MANLIKPSAPQEAQLRRLDNSQYFTMRDIAEIYGKGSGPYELIDEYARAMTLGADLPIKIANGKFENKESYQEPWAYGKHSRTTNIASGPVVTKDSAYQKIEIMGMRDGARGYEEREMKAQGPSWQAFRNYEMAKLIKAIALDNEHDMIYADPRKDPQTYLGILPRFSMITDQEGVIQSGEFKGMLSNYITIDAGGTTEGGVFSLLLIIPGKDEVSWMVPSDTLWSAGINAKAADGWSDQLVREDDGLDHLHRQMTDTVELVGGISVAKRTSCIRIANCDPSSADGAENLSFAIDQAFEILDQAQAAKARIYYPQKCGALIRKAYRGLVTPAKYDDAIPSNIGQDFSIDGHNFRQLFHLTKAENVIK